MVKSTESAPAESTNSTESTPVVEVAEVATKIYSAKDFAIALGIDAKALRSIMRKMTNPDDQPGSGGRWAIEVPSERAAELVARVKNAHHRKVTRF